MEIERESLCLSTYDQDVVELLHAVDLGQQLVDHGVVDSRAARHAATLFADGVDLIKYDDVEAAVGTKLLSRKTRKTMNEKGSSVNCEYVPLLNIFLNL